MSSAPTVYGTAGNHEAHPSNVFLPIEHGNASQWIYDTLTDAWSRWLNPEALKSSRLVGAYSTLHPTGNDQEDSKLRIISLNTNMFYVQNYYLFRKEMDRDPNGQLAWLVEELDAAERAGERVYIIGHVAPGLEDAFHDQSNYMDQVTANLSFPFSPPHSKFTLKKERD
jgi:sphingomyelin phosphodiesterase